jgi:hypothetical protein
MPPGPEQLVVRQHERYVCRLPAQVRVAAEIADCLVLADTVGDGAGAVDATIVDCSRGGLGLECGLFFPRGARLLIRPLSAGPDAPDADVVVRVMRVTMTDRRPTYYVGVAFAGTGVAQTAAAGALLDLARAASGAAQPAPQGAAPAPPAAPGAPRPPGGKEAA